MVLVEGDEIEVVARGERAVEIGQLQAGEPVEVEGTLVIHHWRTHEGKPRVAATVEARKVQSLNKCPPQTSETTA